MRTLNIQKQSKRKYTGPGGYRAELVVVKAKKSRMNIGFYFIRIPKHKKSDAHYHSKQDEIFYFLDSAEIKINGRMRKVKANTVVYVGPKDAHEIKPFGKEVRFIAIRFPYSTKDKILTKNSTDPKI